MLYDPKDTFSLLNPYSSVNVLIRTNEWLGEQNRITVKDSDAYVRAHQPVAEAPLLEWHQTEFTTSGVSSGTRKARKSGRGYFALIGTGLVFAALVMILQ